MAPPIRLRLLVVLMTAFLTARGYGSPDDLGSRLGEIVRAWHDAGLFDGAVLVAKDGEVVWRGGFGPADRATDRPNGPDARYPIASLTKQFTAVLVLRQVERGTIDLGGAVVDYLPWYRADTGARITIRTLLAHQSGLPEMPGRLYLDERPQAVDAAWVVRRYGQGDLEYAPGAGFSYTNTDYHLLGAILEAVTGRTFEELLRDEIIGPLGLHNTGIARRDAPPVNLARDYVRDGEAWLLAPAYRWENWGAAGAMYSTLGDLHRWDQALTSGELLAPATTKRMLTPVGSNYVALGSWVYPRRLPGSEFAPTLVERRGAIGGVAVLNVFVKDEDAWIVLLANHYNESIHTLPWASCLPLDLLMVLHGLEPEGPPAETPAPPPSR